MAKTNHAKAWYKRSVVYEIYARSFADSNGDGIGDIPGIIGRLDYLHELGVDVVWLSPVYVSPQVDNGYDISDYQAIAPEFGKMDDWQALLDGLHARGMRLVMDLVVNHSSDAHAWFRESRKSCDNPYSDFYIWRDGKNGGPPNNWASVFGGSAWEYDAGRDQYYLHLFAREQPDLNWESPGLRQAVFAMMRFWLDKGIDGFRMDVINFISKHPDFPDAPVTGDGPYHWGGQYFVHGPGLETYLKEIKAVLKPYDVMTVGEAPLASTEHAIALTDEENGSVNMLFQFEHVDLETRRHGGPKWNLHAWELADLKEVITKWQTGLEDKGWNSLYLSNHDQPRAVSRFGNDGMYRVQSAKMLAIFLHMLKGTPYIYQGEEIGMTNMPFASIAECRDVETLNIYDEFVHGRGMDPEAAMALIRRMSRDNARTPMQWDDGKQAGFTTGDPWIGVNPNYADINVAAARADPHSIFACYQALIRLRRDNPVMIHGRYRLICGDHRQIYAFTRAYGDEVWLVVCNFSASTPVFDLPDDIVYKQCEPVIGNYEISPSEDIRSFSLQPFEARVYRLSCA